MEKELETTFYRFYSEIRGFLSKLISDPIKAEPSKYLKDRNFGKSKTINVLMDKGILERHESIKDQTNSPDIKKPTYTVKYKVKKKNFETKIHRIYSKYFEKNLPEKKEKEIDECSSCGSVGGANGMGYDVPLFGGNPMRQKHLQESEFKPKTVFANEDEEIKKLEKADPAYKTRGGLNKMPKRVYITQEQFNIIQEMINTNNAGDADLEEATATTNIGSVGNYTANGLVLKTSDGKPDPCYKR